MSRYLQRVFCTTGLVLFVAQILLSCTPHHPPEVRGVVLGFMTKPCVYDLRTGRSLMLNQWSEGFHPSIECDGPGDTLLISYALSSEGNWKSDLPWGRAFFYKWAPCSRELQEVPNVDYQDSWCRAIDYDGVREQYVFFGFINDIEGVYVLNRRFELIEEVRLPSPIADSARLIKYGVILSTGHLAMQYKGGIYLLRDTVLTSLSEHGDLLARSKDGTLIVYRENKDNGAYDATYVLNVSTGDSKRMQTDRKVMSASLSPDNRFVAYNHRTGLVLWSGSLRVYDLETDEDYATGFGSVRGIDWIDPAFNVDSLFSPTKTDSLISALL